MTFKPGESGNPNGRPKGKIGIKSLIEKVWNEELKDDNGDPYIRGLLSIKAMMDKAEAGDVQAFKVLAERMEGMPNQTVDLNAQVVEMPTIKKDGQELTFNIGSETESGSEGTALGEAIDEEEGH